MTKDQRVLLTSAAGAFGRELRRRLPGTVALLRARDRTAMTPAAVGIAVVRCDLADAAAVRGLARGIDETARYEP